jgi:hypothetical protein
MGTGRRAGLAIAWAVRGSAGRLPFQICRIQETPITASNFRLSRLGLGLLIVAVALFGMASFTDAVYADQHHSASSKVEGKTAGQHTVLHSDGHKAHAHVTKKGQVNHVTVKDKKGKDVETKKVKKKVQNGKVPEPDGMFVTVGEPGLEDSASATGDPDPQGGVTIYVGWGFYNSYTQVWVYIWFRVDLVQGGTDGCSDYNGGGDDGGWPAPLP